MVITFNSSAEFFADQAPEMPLEIRRLCDKIQQLSPDKLKILESVPATWIEKD